MFIKLPKYINKICILCNIMKIPILYLIRSDKVANQLKPAFSYNMKVFKVLD